ncbi:MAG TPA: helix-turn-helix domain-containing protein [Chthoniobacterales bacterium]|nr:helix-turn-helix domain-containing protein [Chthoniobacterales bacterium]
MLQMAGSRSDPKAPRGKQTLWSNFSYRRDNEIFGEGEPAHYVYQITSGAVRTFKLLSDGRRQIGAFHLPGDVFGIESGYFYRFTAEAIRETRVRIAKQERLFHGDSEASGFSSKELLKLIAGSLERAESHVLLLGRQNALERVATFFTEMDRRLRSPKVLVLPMRRVDIADYLGLTHETVTRCFSTLRDWGILGYPDKSHREIVLHDKVQLAQLASGVDKHFATISHAVG